MAVIHQVEFSSNFAEAAVQRAILSMFAAQAWQWWDENPDFEVIKLSILVASKTFRAKDCRRLMVLLFGEHP